VIHFNLNLYHVEYLLQGAVWTLALSAIALAGGAVLGFAVALAYVGKSRWMHAAAVGFVQIVQGTPLLILMFIAYFGLAILGSDLPALVAAGASLTIYAAAFLGDIWRGCFQAGPPEQWEGAWSLGLHPLQALRLVILPQALRIAIPPTVGFLVQMVKNTSIASVVGFIELTRAAQIVNNSTFQPFLCFLIVGAIYFAICYPMSRWSIALEARMARGWSA
jgi:polar amino acid transport system permease protein